MHVDWLDESEKYPEDKEHRETEIFAAPATRRHMQNFLEARRERKRPVADIEEGYISSACCILANLSMDLGRSLTWDAENGRVVGDDEWHALGTAEDTSPRVFHDVAGLAAGTLVEYRSVSTDAAGNRSAASTYASVGNRVSLTAPAEPEEPETPEEPEPQEPTDYGFVSVPGSFSAAASLSI